MSAKILQFDPSRCRPSLRMRTEDMLNEVLGVEAEETWCPTQIGQTEPASSATVTRIFPPEIDLWDLENLDFAGRLRDLSITLIYAIQSKQLLRMDLISPLMDLQNEAERLLQHPKLKKKRPAGA